MKAKSIKGVSIEEIQSAVQQSMSDGFKPTLAIALVSIKQDRNAICKLLNDEGITIFGATTNGGFIDDEIEQGSAAILLLEMNPDYFTILFEEYPNKNYREVAAGMATKTMERFAHPSFLLPAAIWKQMQSNCFLVSKM